METSILRSVRNYVGVGADDDSFDSELVDAINSEFSTLHDLGVGPTIGFVIEDDSIEWSEFLNVEDDPEKQVWLSKVKMAVNLRTRLLFDPPVQSFHVNALQEQLKEHEWRLHVNREAIDWVNPNPPIVVVEEGI